MIFKIAVDALNCGSNIRRAAWQEGLFLTRFGETILCFLHESNTFNYELNIIDSNDWIIVGDAEENLISFVDALEFLRLGKRVKLVDWPKGTFLELEKDRKSIFMKQNSLFPFIPTAECLLALDWEIADDIE